MTMLGMRKISRCRYREKVRGFGITELAIVLGIATVIIGGLWALGAHIYVSNQIRVGVQELQAITDNIRAEFSEQGGVTDTGGGALTQALDQMRVFPIEMRQNQSLAAGIIFNPWSINPENGLGSVYVDADNCAGTANTAGAAQSCFGVTFYDVPKGVCLQLMKLTTQPGRGLQIVEINTWNAGALPITIANAEAGCEKNGKANPDGTNTVNILWVYSVKSGGQ